MLYMLGQAELARLLLPIGEADQGRGAGSWPARTGCARPQARQPGRLLHLQSGGQGELLSQRIPVRPGPAGGDRDGEVLGTVDALELVTVGQRRGLGLCRPARGPSAVTSLDVDLRSRTATVGTLDELLVDRVEVEQLSWCRDPVAGGAEVQAQFSAHGARRRGGGKATTGREPLSWSAACAESLPGQAVVLYRLSPGGDTVLGGGTAC